MTLSEKLKQTEEVVPMNKSQKHSFTLIELLIVIAIIAILAAMLLPALGQTKMTAKGTTCKSRMKTITLANQLYHADYGYWAPFRDTSFGSGSSGYFGFHCYISPYMGNYLDQFKGTWNTMEKNRHKVSEPFLCPVQDPQVFAQINPYYKTKVPLISQFMVNYAVPDNKFKQLSNAVMVSDTKKNVGFIYTYYNFTKILSWFDPRHSKKANTGFFDGSVRAEQYIEEKFITFNLTKTGKGMIHSGPAESL